MEIEKGLGQSESRWNQVANLADQVKLCGGEARPTRRNHMAAK